MGSFDDCRKCRSVFKTIIEDGYAFKILAFKQGEQSKDEAFVSICNELDSKFQYPVCDISFSLQNILYGLGIIENVDAYSHNLNYDWLNKLEDIKSVLIKTKDGLDTEFVVLNNIPSDAQIYVDGKSIAHDDESIVLVLTYGVHHLKIVSPMYHNYETTIVVDRANPAPIDVTLDPKFGSLLIITGSNEPVDVYLDNKKVGVTPFSSRVVMSGIHSLKLSSPLYKEYEESFVINDGEKLVKNIQLSPNYGDVIINAVDESTSMLIDGKIKATGHWKGKLALGKHQIECFKSAHSNLSVDIYIYPGHDLRNEISIPLLKSICGCLIINVNPIGSEVYLDNKYIGKSPLKYRDIIIGQHTISIKHQDCYTLEETIFITKDYPVSLILPLNRKCYRNYNEAKIGDYFYADGSFSSELIEKAPIGIIYSLETTEEEKSAGWMHGKIISCHYMPGNVKYAVERVPIIANEMINIKHISNHSDWKIPTEHDWIKILKNIAYTDIKHPIGAIEKKALGRLGIHPPYMTPLIAFSSGIVKVLSYNRDVLCFNTEEMHGKIKGIAAF